MELNETKLKERFETAVGGVSPHVTALVDGGSARGAQLHRRRRAQGFGAVVASAAAIAAIAYVGVDQGLFDTDATGPSHGTVSQAPTEPSTPRSLAAVAMSHIDLEPFVVGTDGGESPKGQVTSGLGYKTDGGNAELQLAATPNLQGWDMQQACEPGDDQSVVETCERHTLDDGGRMVTVAERVSADTGPGAYIVVVIIERPGELTAVIETMRGTRSDADVPVAQADLPVDIATMQDIATDPRFGLTTDPEAIRQGEAIDNFEDGGLTVTDSGSSSSSEVAPEQSAPAPTQSNKTPN